MPQRLLSVMTDDQPVDCSSSWIMLFMTCDNVMIVSTITMIILGIYRRMFSVVDGSQTAEKLDLMIGACLLLAAMAAALKY